MSRGTPERLDQDTIRRAFELLNARLARDGIRAEIVLVGGAVMCLVHQARATTKDVDAWFSEPRAVRQAAEEVAGELGLPEGWLNDAAKGFIPPNAGYETWRAYSHLTVSTIDPQTLLAMKCAAARVESDVEDIRFLAQLLELKSADQVLDVVTRYFPADRLPARTKYLIEEMFDASA